ncbi:hypothetical protein HF319_10980 [Xanthomonas sp. Kuri4-1]
MFPRLTLHAIALCVLVPSTLVTAFWALMGAGYVVGEFGREAHGLAPLLVLCSMVTGGSGMFTAWYLYLGLANGRTDLGRPIVWVGLALGSATSLALMAVTGGSLGFRVTFLGWPLLAVAYFAFALGRAPTGTRA